MKFKGDMAIIFYLCNSYTETAVRYVGLLYMIEVIAHSLKSYQNMEKMFKTMRSPRQWQVGWEGWVVWSWWWLRWSKAESSGTPTVVPTTVYCALYVFNKYL